jgi:glycine cleavage system H lipoate-binding protein
MITQPKGGTPLTTTKQISKKAVAKTSPVWGTRSDSPPRPCIWMQAGVTARKNCTHYYACTGCKYDAAMDKAAAAGRHLSWQEAMRRQPGTQRICRHAMTGRADMRTCPMNYNCDRCEFDQMFEDTLTHTRSHEPGAFIQIKGFDLANDYYFHAGHTWASIDSGGVIRVGMDDFSFKVLGGPDGFDLPLVGQELNQARPGWGIRRKQNQADVRSPVNGVITRVNETLRSRPDQSRNHPYGDGWLFTVHNPDIKGAVKNLMDDETSVPWLDSEITTLEGMIEEITGPLATDGGVLKPDVFAGLPALGWDRLILTFL